MPVNKDALFRYLCIDIKLRRNPAPSLTVLKNFCEQELTEVSDNPITLSEETIKKDISHLRNYFSAPIDYDKSNNFYYYQINDYTFLSLGNDLIEKLINNIKIHYLFSGRVKLEDFIQFETITSGAGWGNVPIIANAIYKKKIIRIKYKPVNQEKIKEYVLHPYLLKENRNSWYLLCKKDGERNIRTFALSRIEGKPEITKEKFNKDKNFNSDTYFSGSIGITAQTGEPAQIILSFTPQQAEYLLAKPLHKSQEVIRNNKQEFRIKIVVEPTYELFANILSYGENVVVISPDDIKEKIMDQLSNSLKNYSQGK